MKVEYMNPFLISTCNTFEIMLGTRPERGTPKVGTETAASYEVSAIVGLSGDTAQGNVVFSLTKLTSLKVVSKFLSEEIKTFDAEVADGIGEIVNMIGGGAKAELSKLGFKMNISLPTVIVGKGEGHELWQKAGVPRIILPFTSDIGDFTVEFSLKT